MQLTYKETKQVRKSQRAANRGGGRLNEAFFCWFRKEELYFRSTYLGNVLYLLTLLSLLGRARVLFRGRCLCDFVSLFL